MTTLATTSHTMRIVSHRRSPSQHDGASGLVGDVIETDVHDEATYVYVDFGRPARDKAAVLGWGDAHLSGLGLLIGACSVHELDEVWAFRFVAGLA